MTLDSNVFVCNSIHYLNQLVLAFGKSFRKPKNPKNRGVFIVNFEHISQLFLVFLLLALIKKMLAGIERKIECLSRKISGKLPFQFHSLITLK